MSVKLLNQIYLLFLHDLPLEIFAWKLDLRRDLDDLSEKDNQKSVQDLINWWFWNLSESNGWLPEGHWLTTKSIVRLRGASKIRKDNQGFDHSRTNVAARGRPYQKGTTQSSFSERKLRRTVWHSLCQKTHQSCAFYVKRSHWPLDKVFLIGILWESNYEIEKLL